MKPLQALITLFACAFLPLHAAGLNDLTYTTTDGKVTITDCNDDATGELVIPAIIEGNPVISIGMSAFLGGYGLTSITIPDGVTSIGYGAFYRCTSLTSITIPDSVTFIWNSAFSYCTSLTSITIPDGVTGIGFYTFNGCTSLSSITIPDGVTSIGESAFSGCTSLTSITIPDSVTSIGDRAFYNCISLTSITIPDSVTSIGNGAFNYCSSLDSINVINSNVNFTDVNGVLFDAEMELLHTYPAGKNDLFYNIPNSVTSIGNSAFSYCTSLTSITIPDGVTGIGFYTFNDCTSLTSIRFQGAAPTIGFNVFIGLPEEAQAYVSNEFSDSFGGFGNTWEGLTVAIQRAIITNCGFVNATTFFIEFEPAGAGYRVMSSPTLDFGNAVEVTPTLQPTSGSDNRFELTPDGSRNFYRLEPTE